MRGVPTDSGRGLGAEVAIFRVKIERADAVFTLRAGEPYAALDALDTVRFHSCIVTLRKQDGGARWCGGEGNWRAEGQGTRPGAV